MPLRCGQAPDRARVIGLIVFAGTIGAIFGPLLVGPAGLLAQQLGGSVYAGPYWIGAMLTVAAALLIFVLLRPDPKELSHRREVDRQSESGPPVAARPLRTIFGLPLVQLAVASMVVGQLVMTLIMVITPVHMHHLDHTTGEISLVFTAHTLGMFGFAWATGWLIDRLGSMPMIAYGAGLLIVASLLAPVAGNVLTLAVALFVLGLGWNFCFVAGSALLSNQLHYDERGRVQGTNELLISLASGAGSLLTGVIFAGGGMLRVGAVGLAITLIFAVFATWRWRRQDARRKLRHRLGAAHVRLSGPWVCALNDDAWQASRFSTRREPWPEQSVPCSSKKTIPNASAYLSTTSLPLASRSIPPCTWPRANF